MYAQENIENGRVFTTFSLRTNEENTVAFDAVSRIEFSR